MSTRPSSPPPTRTHRRRRQSPIQRAFRRINKWVKWQVIVVVLLLLVIIPTAGIIVLASDSSARVQETFASVKRVVGSLGQRSFDQLTMTDFDRLQISVQNLSDSLSAAQSQNGFLQHLSFINADLGTTFQILSAAQHMAQAGTTILSGLQPTLFFITQGQKGDANTTQISSGERIIELLQTGQGQFITAQHQIDTAQQLLNGIDPKNASPQVLLKLEQINQYEAQLKSVNDVLLRAPDALSKVFGMNTPQNYLVLSKNNYELRPSGGYISPFGWLRVRRFRIADYGYSPTTSTSPNPPPQSMASEIHVPDWWLQQFDPLHSAWDESWYADFPSTAKMSAWYYDNGQNPRSPVDGVIGIDLFGFKEILGSLGSVNVPEFNAVVTADNFRDVVYEIRNSTDMHKEFLAATYQAIFNQWQTIDSSHSSQLFIAILNAFREKHFVVYFKDAQLNDLANLAGYSGAQMPGNNDYLMVADANLGNKSNSSVVRQITYDVAIQPDASLKSRVTLSYDYSAALADKDPAVKPEDYGDQKDYYNLMQVYLPKGVTITGTDNLPTDFKTIPDATMTTLAVQTKVVFDTSERYQISYTTPPLLESVGGYQRYRLLLQTQLR